MHEQNYLVMIFIAASIFTLSTGSLNFSPGSEIQCVNVSNSDQTRGVTSARVFFRPNNDTVFFGRTDVRIFITRGTTCVDNLITYVYKGAGYIHWEVSKPTMTIILLVSIDYAYINYHYNPFPHLQNLVSLCLFPMLRHLLLSLILLRTLKQLEYALEHK